MIGMRPEIGLFTTNGDVVSIDTKLMFKTTIYRKDDRIRCYSSTQLKFEPDLLIPRNGFSKVTVPRVWNCTIFRQDTSYQLN